MDAGTFLCTLSKPKKWTKEKMTFRVMPKKIPGFGACPGLSKIRYCRVFSLRNFLGVALIDLAPIGNAVKHFKQQD